MSIGCTFSYMTNTLAVRLLLCRRDFRMTQKELSELSGVSRSYIAQVERGDVTNVGIERLTALAKVLDVSVAYLVGETDIATSEEDEEEILGTKEAQPTYNAIDPTTKELLDLIEGMDTAQRRQMVDVARIIFRPPRIIE